MYPYHLGKFNIPAEGHWSMPKEGWVAGVAYQPEPPLAVRGALNPWADERQREVYLAEELAWKKIVPLQAEFRQLYRRQAAILAEVQHWLRDLERLTGKSSGMSSTANYAVLLYSLAGGPYAWAAALGKLGLDMILGIGKKKQGKRIMARLEQLAAEIAQVQARMQAVTDTVTQLIQIGEGIRAGQHVKVTADVAQSESLYRSRQQLDRQRAFVLRERNRQVALLPRPSGGSDAI